MCVCARTYTGHTLSPKYSPNDGAKALLDQRVFYDEIMTHTFHIAGHFLWQSSGHKLISLVNGRQFTALMFEMVYNVFIIDSNRHHIEVYAVDSML